MSKTGSTRQRIVDASAELFRRQGYTGTGLKQIVREADAPFGSIYHFFPGGKEELGTAAIRASGAFYQALVESVWDAAGGDVVEGVRYVFLAAAQTLPATEYADACPIATVSLEVASTNEALRQACEEVYLGWIDACTDRLAAGGIEPVRARELAFVVLSLLEGAFVFCRTLRTTEALEAAADAAASLVQAALRAPGGGPAGTD